MFYSHQLLARKAPLGQIWMAATMHAKINRRKLDKLDIIKICEEILNPSVPMALRLSGILMGGVVIVYERKVKLLYDDVTRFLVEINEAWKIKPAADPTVLPKGKTQAKYEAVTLPDHAVNMEVEQAMHFSDASMTTARFQKMRLDDLDEVYINISMGEHDPTRQNHQAEAANITIFDDFGSGLVETEFYSRFERFDIDGDEETQIKFTPKEHSQAPPNLIPSPAPQNQHSQAPAVDVLSTPPDPRPDDATMAAPMEEQEEQRKEISNETREMEEDAPRQVEEDAPRRRPVKRKACRNIARVDDDQTMIPGPTYLSWLRDASDIVSKRQRKKPLSPFRSVKISDLMDLPPVALICEVKYPAPLMELWRKCTEANPARDSSSATRRYSERSRISPDAPEKPASHSPTEGFYHQEVPDSQPGDVQSEVGSQQVDSIEMLRAQLGSMDFGGPNEALASGGLVTPGSPGRSTKSIPSSGSGHAFMSMESEILPSGRSKRRLLSSSRASLGNLYPVDEETPLERNEERSYKLKKLPEHGPSPDELLEETGPTPTPHPMFSEPSVDRTTQSIRSHLKSHFDTPGAPPFESLDQLANGMNRKKAALLFYQTCVLATFGFVKVQQAEPYEDILISRGPKM